MLPEILLSLRAINIFLGYGKDKKNKLYDFSNMQNTIKCNHSSHRCISASFMSTLPTRALFFMYLNLQGLEAGEVFVLVFCPQGTL